MSSSVPDAVRANFIEQVEACRRLGSPFTALVCDTLPGILDRESRFGRRILDWPGNPRADALALRAAAGFHRLHRAGHAPALAEVYPPRVAEAAALATALRTTVARSDAFLHDWLDSPPQTNEVARSAVLLGGALWIAAETGLPFDWFEIGASAGLNLGFDRYRYELGGPIWGRPDAPVLIRSAWHGPTPPVDAPLAIVERGGCDIKPIDPASAADRERLLAYIWADQNERLSRTEAALSIAAAASWKVEKADAADWVAARLLAEAIPSRGRVLAHTIMWQYMPEPTRERIGATIAAAADRARRDRPLAWLRMEADSRADTASVRLTLWPGGVERELGRADFHGRFVEWAT